MKPKHTPGPWTVDTSGMHLAIRGNLSDRKHMAHEEVVARPYNLDDARLIAAAPQLLEALKMVMALNPGAVFINGADGEMYSEWDLAHRAVKMAGGAK